MRYSYTTSEPSNPSEDLTMEYIHKCLSFIGITSPRPASSKHIEGDITPAIPLDRAVGSYVNEQPIQMPTPVLNNGNMVEAYQAPVVSTRRQDAERDHPEKPPLLSQPQTSIKDPEPSNNPAPWETWTLDQDFLSQVYDYRSKGGDNKLVRSFSSIDLERYDVFLEVVPDGPIPIRGLVKALTFVVKLGIDVANAKTAALEFARGVLQWVDNVAVAFKDGPSGRFTAHAWSNLAEIRKVIENACTWAHNILNGSIIERFSVNNKILDFQKEFSSAIQQFGALNQINIAKGQDFLIQQIDDFQDHVNHHFEVVTRNLAEMVQKPQLPDVSHQTQRKIPCDPSTRKKLLSDIMEWICDISDSSPSFFWLSGDPGVGKSAVTASIAKECKLRGILGAEYFINRNDSATVDPLLYFPSIVHQISERHPAVASFVARQIPKDQQDIMKEDMSLQATSLFENAIRVASEANPTKPIAIIIDALDETDVKRLKATASIFAHVLDNLPCNVKVFISSRVEDVIRDSFARHPRVRNIHLSAKNSIADVTRFLEDKIHEIMRDFKIPWAEWGEERTQKLCAQASGLFIWAVTAIEYIRSEIENSGRECLYVILDELNSKGMDNINALYLAILKRTYQKDVDPWSMQRFRRIIGAILTQQIPLSIADLQGLLDVRRPSSGAPADMEHFVRRHRTVLVAGVGEISLQTVPRVHKSFADFITSPKAEVFRVNMVESHGELALQSINQLLRLWDSDEFPGQLSYAVTHWSSHLTRMVGALMEEEKNESGSEIDSEDSNAGKEKSSAPITTKPPKDQAGRDPQSNRGITIFPDRGRIAYARGNSVLVRDLRTGDYVGAPLEGHTEAVRLATFSPDARHIISASADNTVIIWDAETGKQVGERFTGHQEAVHSAIFSPDGRRIVSNSRDGVICVWDPTTGNVLHTLIETSDDVNLAIFSPDARHIASASDDQLVRVMDILTGEVIRVFEGHSTWVASAYFSPDGKQILTCSSAGVMKIWDLATGELLPNAYPDQAVLSLPESDLSSQIIVPEDPDMQDSHSKSSLSYSFRVGESGVAAGTSNMWIYVDLQKSFVMGTYQGQLIMQFLYGIERYLELSDGSSLV